jgi:hypothetical protein
MVRHAISHSIALRALRRTCTRTSKWRAFLVVPRYRYADEASLYLDFLKTSDQEPEGVIMFE